MSKKRGSGIEPASINVRSAEDRFVQEVQSQTAEPQILVSADWVTDVSVRRVALFVSETVNRHRKELDAILEIVVDVWSGGGVALLSRRVYSLRLKIG